MAQSSLCLIDTNVLLHFKPLEQLDWPSLVGSDQVRLIVGIEVVSELDDHKLRSAILRLKKRAAAALIWIETKSDQDEIRSGVSFAVAPHEVKCDWDSLGLDPAIADDRIIGRALLLIEDGERVVLATDDTAIRLKAKAHRIPCCDLPREDRLPDLKTDEELQLEQLTKELSALKNAVPDLRLGFLSEDDLVQHFRFVFAPVAPMAPEELARIVDEETGPHAYEGGPTAPESPYSALRGTMVRMAMFGRRPTQDELTDYLARFSEYKELYAEYVKQRDDFRHLRSRTIGLPLVLANQGAASADDIDVVIQVPDPVTLCEVDSDEEPWPADIPPPEPPERPWESRLLQNLAMTSTVMPFAPRYATPSSPNVSSPSIRRVSSYEVTYKIRRLKQASRVELDPIWVYYAADPFCFSMTYTIISHTRPDVQDGVLRVVKP